MPSVLFSRFYVKCNTKTTCSNLGISHVRLVKCGTIILSDNYLFSLPFGSSIAVT